MTRVVAIDPAVHRTIENYTDRMVEVGGTLKFNQDKTRFVFDTVRCGMYNAVGIPEGIVQFHTHPTRCNAELCTLGIPSTQDLMEFSKAFMRGETLIHCLYSIDGTYCISIKSQTQRTLRGSAKNKWRVRTEKNLRSFFSTLDMRRMTRQSYNEFRDNWIALARSQGISVYRYEVGVVPSFRLTFY